METIQNSLKTHGKRKQVAQVAAFFILFFLLFFKLQAIFLPDWSYVVNCQEGDTEKYQGFYSLPANSLDYIVIGASHSFYSTNPMQIYAETGFTGYDLGSPSQSIQLSYYWMKEAFKTQRPKIVFYDVISLFYSHGTYNAALSKAIIPMRPSLNKLEAIIQCSNSKEQISGLLMPMYQFHTRWTELNQKSFHQPERRYLWKGAYIDFNNSFVMSQNNYNTS